ncbi:ABC transporter permease [Micromonospora sp. 4G57]|uniref:Transport permease protein n=1 Tax=Micromonospora sicca TaxID=2202420 RepID=A0ABU5JP47_9ACTN|nr:MULTISPECIES: ABC transporter permease [unclassified Micromonospora]MDZ5447111.1 ABC transporter permease [Micromonospora sp. 4G57]MDZ5494148.1 ABC transporter permease [Micromonospora sp. 4G53]
MTSLAYTLADSTTMLRRQVRHMQRYPSLTGMLIALPVILLLLFVYVFGETLGAGLPGGGGDRGAYINYLVPGILVFSVTGAAQGTAISIAMDITEGIVDRFRTMAISRAALLTGHVLGSLIQTMLCIAVVLAIALAIGFRPTATPIEWLAATGVLAAIAFALIWLSVALGMVSDSVETASNLPMFLTLLPFLGSGFVPTDTMPAGLRWFADYQPFTPVIETLRGLLLGTGIGNSAAIALAWCAAISLLSYLWAKHSFHKRAAR